MPYVACRVVLHRRALRVSLQSIIRPHLSIRPPSLYNISSLSRPPLPLPDAGALDEVPRLLDRRHGAVGPGHHRHALLDGQLARRGLVAWRRVRRAQSGWVGFASAGVCVLRLRFASCGCVDKLIQGLALLRRRRGMRRKRDRRQKKNSPNVCRFSAVGPTKVIPLSLQCCAKSVLSDNKPYPGWIASTLFATAMATIPLDTRQRRQKCSAKHQTHVEQRGLIVGLNRHGHDTLGDTRQPRPQRRKKKKKKKKSGLGFVGINRPAPHAAQHT